MSGNNLDMPGAEALLEDPRYLLHRIDTSSSRLAFLETDRQRLSNLAFIDGRAPLSAQARSYSVRIRDALAWLPAEGPGGRGERLIFHVSFCGSTLLARACEVPDRAFALREPRALLDLATIKAQRLGYYTDQDLWSRLVRLTLGQLRKSPGRAEVSIVKPSNWANSILPDLLRYGQRPRAVLLTIGLKDYLVAVLRGGEERIGYARRLANHFQAEDPELGRQIDQAEAPRGDRLVGHLRLAALAWQAQIRIFDRAPQSNAGAHLHRLSYGELLKGPAAALEGVSRALKLNLSGPEIASSLERTLTRDAKNPDRRFDRERARQANLEIEKRYRPLIDGAVDWYQSVTGP